MLTGWDSLNFGQLHKMTDHSTDCLYAVVVKIYNAVLLSVHFIEETRRLLGQLPMGDTTWRKRHYGCGEQEKLMSDRLNPPVRGIQHFWEGLEWRKTEKQCRREKSAMRGREEDNCIPSQNSDAPPDPHHRVTDRKTLHEERDTNTAKTCSTDWWYQRLSSLPSWAGTAYTMITTETASNFDVSY